MTTITILSNAVQTKHDSWQIFSWLYTIKMKFLLPHHDAKIINKWSHIDLPDCLTTAGMWHKVGFTWGCRKTYNCSIPATTVAINSAMRKMLLQGWNLRNWMSSPHEKYSSLLAKSELLCQASKWSKGYQSYYYFYIIYINTSSISNLFLSKNSPWCKSVLLKLWLTTPNGVVKLKASQSQMRSWS